MKIWVDSDSCPKQVRTIIFRAANKRHIHSFFVANRALPIRETEYIHPIVTCIEEQAADNYIIMHASSDDLVVTRDIPLAKCLLEKGMTVINDRGTEFSLNDINMRLSLRNFFYELSAAGLKPESTQVFSKRNLQDFAACFDTVLTKKQKALSTQ